MNIPKGTIIEITISVRAENDLELDTDNIHGNSGRDAGRYAGHLPGPVETLHGIPDRPAPHPEDETPPHRGPPTDDRYPGTSRRRQNTVSTYEPQYQSLNRYRRFLESKSVAFSLPPARILSTVSSVGGPRHAPCV